MSNLPLITIADQNVDLHYMNILKRGWELYKKYFSLLVVMWLISFGIQLLVSWSSGLVEDASALITLPVMVASVAISVIISAGFMGVYIAISKEETIKVSDLFQQVGLSGRYFLGQLAYGLLVMLGFILLIIPGIYWSYKYTFVPYLIIGKKSGVGEAFSLSGEMTRGIKIKMLIFNLIIGLVNLAGLLALGIGLIITIPITTIGMAVLYTALLERLNKIPRVESTNLLTTPSKVQK